MNLRELMVDAKTVEVPFEGFEPFKVTLSYISRTELSKMVESSQVGRMSKASRMVEKELDTDKFLTKFVDRAIKGWSGLTLEVMSNFLPIQVPEGEEKSEVDFTKENALFLIKECQMFDDWVNAKITDIDTFR